MGGVRSPASPNRWLEMEILFFIIYQPPSSPAAMNHRQVLKLAQVKIKLDVRPPFLKMPFVAYDSSGENPESHRKRNRAIVQGNPLSAIRLLPSLTIVVQSFSKPAQSSRNLVRPAHRVVGRLTMPVPRSPRPAELFTMPARAFRKPVGSLHKPVGRFHRRVESSNTPIQPLQTLQNQTFGKNRRFSAS